MAQWKCTSISHTKLSAAGVRQAELVAGRLGGVNADLILSSRLPRAVQTARIIGKRTGKRIVYTNFLNEIRGPSEVWGLKRKSKKAKAIWKEIEKHRYEPEWYYSDEENVFDLKRRAIRAIKYIKGKGKGTLIVVSHGMLVQLLIGILMLGEDADMRDLVRVSRFLEMENTGITECRIDDDGRAKLLTFNDHAHLRGE